MLIPIRFKNIAAAHPNAVAIQTNRSFTYQEIDQLTDRISVQILDSLGEGIEPVAMFVGPGEWSAMLPIAAAKAGKFSVEIKPTQCDRFCIQQLDSIDARLVITTSDLFNTLRPMLLPDRADILQVDTGHVFKRHRRGIESFPDEYGTAYCVQFTSGTTAAPKGVVISHEAWLAQVAEDTRICWAGRSPGEISSTRIAATRQGVSGLRAANLALLNGAILVVKSAQDGNRLASWINWARPEIMAFLTSQFEFVLSQTKYLPSIRFADIGGEMVNYGTLDLWRDRVGGNWDSPVFRCRYATTETHFITSALYDRNTHLAQGRLPVGQPSLGSTVFIMDDQLRIQQQGVGEIAAQTPAMAIGYWKDQALTDKKFIKICGRRFYLTGDCGYWENGALHHCGRKDFAPEKIRVKT